MSTQKTKSKTLEVTPGIIDETLVTFEDILVYQGFDSKQLRLKLATRESELVENGKTIEDILKAKVAIVLLAHTKGTNDLLSKISTADQKFTKQIRTYLDWLDVKNKIVDKTELTPLRLLAICPEITSYALIKNPYLIKSVNYTGPLPKCYQHTNAIHLLQDEELKLEWKRWSLLHAKTINSSLPEKSIKEAVEVTDRITDIMMNNPLFTSMEILDIKKKFTLP